MLLNYVGYSETPKTVNDNLKVNGGFQGALLVWGAVQKLYPKVKFVGRYNGYNNTAVWNEINLPWKKMPVMVQVNAAKIGGFYHWVLFIGGGVCLDPWWGNSTSTGYYPPNGYAIYDRA
jgi:hypothetical protein